MLGSNFISLLRNTLVTMTNKPITNGHWTIVHSPFIMHSIARMSSRNLGMTQWSILHSPLKEQCASNHGPLTVHYAVNRQDVIRRLWVRPNVRFFILTWRTNKHRITVHRPHNMCLIDLKPMKLLLGSICALRMKNQF